MLIIGGISLYNFWQKKKEIHENRQEHLDQVKAELKDFVVFFDNTVSEFEHKLSTQAEYFSDTLVNHIFADTKDIESTDLKELRKVIGMTEDQDIYIVNKKGVIVNTTYEEDLGLDFFSFGEFFVNHFNHVWEVGTFVEDRISLEMSTKRPKKYTYQSTLDKQYVVELGLYDTYSENVVELFTQKLNSIADKYRDIDTISLYFGMDKFINYQGHMLTDEQMQEAKTALENNAEFKKAYVDDGVTRTTLFMQLELDDSALQDDYVIRVKYNNERELELVSAEVKLFGLLLLFIIIPISLLILWRAKVIAKPISILLEKMDVIRGGDLGTKVPVIGNNEVTDLAIHFNDMMAELKQSHDTLEEKVAERTRELVEKNKVIESTHKSIQDSINYSKRLQNAVLPKEAEITAHLAESFVLFRPKDVVSGDFYWFENHEKYDFIAAADCTGHGVPGAMVSFVCNNALNRSLYEFSKLSPENVLQHTREIVIETFSKSGHDIKDGMDIALCRLNKDRDELLFVGANNPLWIIRKNEHLSQKELEDRKTIVGDSYSLIEIKGDKKPIGLHEDMTPFTCHNIPVYEGDTYYLFTDGYADQFGGHKGKKLMYKPFKKLLLDMAEASLENQKQELAHSFDTWMGDYEQVDDVCVIGFRL
ncbi:hypothetical protein CRYO30217_02279 [Parvicella tangerina]|uniref:HAMP domain-containing protein n=2 Tax=Parvicella tangerina TaxID=2829795 RepID=A0A916JP04_9FLAO|nr:hypothetical protein CRYO30217_02279 [Parvicella tangerina]